MAKERNYLFDNLKAVLIFCVVFAHFLRAGGFMGAGSLARIFYILCFSFMMEGFFFTSGFFSKNVDKCHAKAVETLVVPYFVFIPLLYLERLWLFGGAHINFLRPSHAMWFLIAMFFYRFGIKYFAKIPFILPLSAILFLAAGTMPFLGPTLALGRSCSFLVFFMLGYFCQWEHIQKIRSIPKPIMIIVGAVLVALSAVCGCFRHFGTGVLMMKNCYHAIHLSIPEGLILRLAVGIAALASIAVLINLLPDRKLPAKGGLISQIGQNTMTVFLLHVAVRYLVKWYTKQDFSIIGAGEIIHSGGILYCLFMLILALIVVYIFSRPIVAKVYDTVMHYLYWPFGTAYGWIKERIRGTNH
ncbi:MAG: hypothetical protein IJI74_04990 [Firmicutes bacterium]|nr:hypothetical protein [Bacillota bacterium]